jgi:hypothetical protein
VDGHLGTSFVEVVHELRLVEEVREGDEGLGVQEGDVDGITRDEFRDDEGGWGLSAGTVEMRDAKEQE